MQMDRVAQVLREIRGEAGLTQTALAARIEQSQPYVSKYESGEQRLDLTELEAICSAAGVTLGDFVKRCQARNSLALLGRSEPITPDEATWLGAMLRLTADEGKACAWLDHQLKFRTALSTGLVSLLRTCTADAPAVYGVWLQGHEKPVYVGQSQNARRRLWDLPIGESHHLANSFPPEVWERVVVVCWAALLDVDPKMRLEVLQSVNAVHRLGPSPHALREAIGLGLEHRLQQRYTPLFNGRKKLRDGCAVTLDRSKSKSLGARSAPHLDRLFGPVLEVWSRLAVAPAQAEALSERGGFGGAIFPARMRQARMY